MKVKVCGITDPENARLIAESSPDYMGFNFYSSSPRYVGDKPDPSLFSLPAEIGRIGVFVDEDPVKVIELAATYELDYVQLHGTETAGYCEGLKLSGLKILKAFGLCEYTDFEMYTSYMEVCDYFLFDRRTAKWGGSGEKFDWSILEKYKLDKPFFLGGGISPGDASSIKEINNDRHVATDINSRFETSPGIKDPVAVNKFIEELKNG